MCSHSIGSFCLPSCLIRGFEDVNRSLTGSECEGYAGGRRKGGGWDVRGKRERDRWESGAGQVGGESEIDGCRNRDRWEARAV